MARGTFPGNATLHHKVFGMPRNGRTAHPFAYDGLDRVIHERARLGVLTSLVGRPEGLLFANLKQLCGLTDGNLSRHLQVLEQAKLIEISKSAEHTRLQTRCRLTPLGLRRYLKYLEVLEQVVLDATTAVQPSPEKPLETLRAAERSM
jgi:DNA-binding MarR family transcriptional regulator